MTTPRASRPSLPAMYGIPDSEEGLLAWGDVVQRLEAARNYWLASARPDGRPHVVAIWGMWLDDAFYCSGAPETRWLCDIAANPAVALHLESGDQVVIVEGQMALFAPDSDLAARLNQASQAKYDMAYDPIDTSEPIWRIQPHTVLAWTHFPADATRFRF
jgi:nitroimidazol reductase NimA-like FMN-containing flavoprotein (pyridoxamine 5'-phosphate oxidase superfamily)